MVLTRVLGITRFDRQGPLDGVTSLYRLHDVAQRESDLLLSYRGLQWSLWESYRRFSNTYQTTSANY